MEFRYDKLLGRIKEKCGKQEEFARKLRISRTTLTHKLNNQVDFRAKEIYMACDILEIPKNEIPVYFFSE